ncbi:UDP-glycosyltransferase 92A1 [Setaria viridis]|uniref:Glycosyltransferase n=1 Tax=Setaria viridis TaxID=4556 RepID=A0A4U6TS53_SETVI|nr:UDP-glycosyltransferase 92A1-like [Setaria viridis]TKW03893.1 hypothetical protein SEVIR_7G073000v2 [Setaria viridis]
MAGNERRAHVVLFPFMAQGHVAPFRCLAELVRRTRPDARVTVVATPGVAEPLRASLDVAVRVHELPFDPAGHGLPAGAGTTAGIGSHHQLIALFAASESLRPAFRRFLAGLRAADPAAAVHVMADMFLGWTLGVARDSGASHSAVLTTGGYGSAVYFSLWNAVPLPLPAAAASPDDAFKLPPFPDVAIRRSQLTDHLAAADGKDAWSTFIHKQIAAFTHTDGLLVNTTEDLEPKGLAMLRQLFNVPIYPVGPLLRATAAPQPAPAPGAKNGGAILAWLDKQPPGSVLYVSFGSQYTIGASQMTELATGLERSGHRFLWVIRPTAASSGLPEGFMERVEASGRGLVARCWAPQVEILAHEATGAFLTHCGWNSVQEALGAGVPLLGWPLSAEQFYNAKVLAEEMGVCVEVARGARAALGAEELAAAVETVLGETVERAEMRRKAAEMKEVIAAARGSGGDGSSLIVMERLFADVMHC